MQLKNILAASLAVVAARAQSNDTSSQNLTALISGNDDLSALATVLQAYPDIATSLANATNVTLFAPNNEALAAVQSTLSSASPDLVQALLTYHVLQGTFYAANISATPSFPHTLLENATYSNVTGGQVVDVQTNGDAVNVISGLKSTANVTQANLNFTGGVVHVIDSVLTVPENFSTTAAAGNLTALLGATEATNLTSAIEGLSDITIFAPSNSAFQAIGSAAANLTVDQAAQILQYHVINGTIAYSSSLANASIPTLGGGNVTVSIVNGTVFINSARVVNADVLLSNGVLHVIDSVLNPNNSMATGNATETAPATAFSGASSATDVPYTSGIPTPTTTITELVTSVTQVAEGYTSQVAAGGAASSTIGGEAGGSSSSSAGAAMATGAVGAAALFGGAAFLANM